MRWGQCLRHNRIFFSKRCRLISIVVNCSLRHHITRTIFAAVASATSAAVIAAAATVSAMSPVISTATIVISIAPIISTIVVSVAEIFLRHLDYIYLVNGIKSVQLDTTTTIIITTTTTILFIEFPGGTTDIPLGCWSFEHSVLNDRVERVATRSFRQRIELLLERFLGTPSVQTVGEFLELRCRLLWKHSSHINGTEMLIRPQLYLRVFVIRVSKGIHLQQIWHTETLWFIRQCNFILRCYADVFHS